MYKAEDYKARKTVAEKASCNYKVVLNKPNVTVAAVKKAEEALNEAISKYNELVRSDAYETVCSGADTIVTAAMAYSITGLMRKKLTRDPETKQVTSCTLEYDETEPYSLKKLENKFAALDKGQLMAKAGWVHQVSEARLYSAAAQCRELNCNLDTFRKVFNLTGDMLVYTADGVCHDVCDMAEAVEDAFLDQLSINQLVPKLQAAVDAIVFDSTGREKGDNRYQVRRADARFFKTFCFWLDDKTSKPHLRTLEKTYVLMFAVLSHVISGVAYDVIWEEAKKK